MVKSRPTRGSREALTSPDSSPDSPPSGSDGSLLSSATLSERLAIYHTESDQEDNGRKWCTNVIFTYLQCYFVTIATILGTGILGLPIKLVHSGFNPFLISFIIAYFMQVLQILFFVDILQRAHAKQLQTLQEDGSENLPLNELEHRLDEELETSVIGCSVGVFSYSFYSVNINPLPKTMYALATYIKMNLLWFIDAVMAGHIIIPKQNSVKPVNLHLLGEIFLPAGMCPIFDTMLLLHFIALLISYALAGAQAFAAVLNVEHVYLIPPFVWILSLSIMFAFKFIQPIVSLLTFGKGSLLLSTVIVTFFIGSSVNETVSSDFSYVGAPFLIGTVALGGSFCVMPMLYNRIQPVKSQVRGFRCAVILGLTTCAILNIIWCAAVLKIVPQTNTCVVNPATASNLYNATVRSTRVAYSDVSQSTKNPTFFCTQNLSLENSELKGEISTIPLTQIIYEQHPEYRWVAQVIEAFMVISITVSFLTLGAALQHTLTGWLNSKFAQSDSQLYTSSRSLSGAKPDCNKFLTNHLWGLHIFVSFSIFGIIFIVAMVDPKGFISMLENVTSILLNLQSGLFIYLMAERSISGQNKFLDIPDRQSAFFHLLRFLLPISFGFAVFYDLFIIIYSFVHHDKPLPWETDYRPVGFDIVVTDTKLNLNSNSNVSRIGPILI